MKMQESLRLSIRVLNDAQEKFKYVESESSFNIDTFRSMTGEEGEAMAKKSRKRDRKIEKHKQEHELMMMQREDRLSMKME